MRRSLAMLTLALLLVGCGNGDEDRDGADINTPQPSTPCSPSSEPSSVTQPARPERELEAAYRTYVAAFLCADAATAYDLLTARCRDKFTLPEFTAASKAAAEQHGELDYKIITVQALGNEGIVVVTSPALKAKGDAVQIPWLLEKGEWHSDRCGI